MLRQDLGALGQLQEVLVAPALVVDDVEEAVYEFEYDLAVFSGFVIDQVESHDAVRAIYKYLCEVFVRVD